MPVGLLAGLNPVRRVSGGTITGGGTVISLEPTVGGLAAGLEVIVAGLPGGLVEARILSGWAVTTIVSLVDFDLGEINLA
jgi:hypothetical protein